MPHLEILFLNEENSVIYFKIEQEEIPIINSGKQRFTGYRETN